MPKKKKIFKYGNNEIPDIYEEIVHFKGKPSFVRYYFKNEKNNKIRAQDKDKIIELYNSFRKRHNKSTIPLITETPSNKDIFSNSKSLKEKLEFLKEKFKIVNQDVISIENEKEVEINGRKIRLDQNIDIPRQWLLEQFKLLLTENPKLLSQELAIEELSYLSKLVPQKRYTLKEIGNFYLERQKYTPKLGLTKKNKNESSQYWNEFILISKAEYIDQIDKDIIVKYNTELTNVATNPTYRPNWLSRWQKKSINNKSLSAKWVKVRLDTIKTILKNAIKAADYTQDIEAVYKLCGKLFYCVAIPKAMIRSIFERGHIESIFEVLNNPKNRHQIKPFIRWKAIILLSLNCAFTTIDITDLRFEDINLDRKELSMIRKKKNTERYAVLWDRTIEAFNKYLEIRTDIKTGDKELIFLSRYGEKFKSQNLSDDFRRLTKYINEIKGNGTLPGELTFKYFRKAAASSAERTKGANPSEVSYLLGHSVGIRQHYTFRAADLVGNVCKKIEEDYFGRNN